MIKETLRLYTPNCPPLERVVPPEGLETSGHFIPAGTVVSICSHAAHRDISIYGDDAEAFRPERWIEADPTQLKQMDQSFLAVS